MKCPHCKESIDHVTEVCTATLHSKISLEEDNIGEYIQRADERVDGRHDRVFFCPLCKANLGLKPRDAYYFLKGIQPPKWILDLDKELARQ